MVDRTPDEVNGSASEPTEHRATVPEPCSTVPGSRTSPSVHWPVVRIGDVIGGMAAIGVVALIGLSLTEDDGPEALTVEPDETILAPATSVGPTTTVSPTTSVGEEAPDEAPTSTVDVATTEDATSSSSSSSTSSTSSTTTSTTTTTTTTYPPEFVPFIKVQVVNGGGGPGAARATTDELIADGFDPESPNDAVVLLDATTVLYPPGSLSEALRVNEVIGALPENVREAVPEDPNWAEFGPSGDLDVLVVVGPS